MNRTSKSSSLLALAMLLFAALACSSGGSDTSTGNGNSSAAAPTATATASTEFTIDEAEMRKADDAGKITDETVTSYSRNEKLFCYVDWDNPKANTKLKFSWVVVEAGGAKNVVLKEFSLTTENELQNEASAAYTPGKPLPKGSYKVDIYVNDKLQRSVPFTIE